MIDARPPRVEYLLTDDGLRLRAVLDALATYAGAEPRLRSITSPGGPDCPTGDARRGRVGYRPADGRIGTAARRVRHGRDAAAGPWPGRAAGEARGGRTAAAQRAVAEERQRIARELHDVIAHSVSVMTVQAARGGAPAAGSRSESGLRSKAIEAHRARGTDGDAAPSVGAPARAGRRCRTSRRSRRCARSTCLSAPSARRASRSSSRSRESRGEPRPGVDLAAYRVIQEALTNALQVRRPGRGHGSRCAGGEARPRARDRKRRPARRAGGRRRRRTGSRGSVSGAALVGGSIESGPRDGGGFVVTARLPYGGSA